MAYAVSVRDFGALGNGIANDAPAFQKALDAGARVVTVPYGQYRIGSPLKIGSCTMLEAHPSATIRLGDHVCVRRGQYLLSNKEEKGGSRNIELRGGIWDGNNIGNPRGELFDSQSPTGTLLNFRNVQGLALRDMVLRDAECYYIRLCEIDGFQIERLAFETVHIRPNQDGVHLAGFCKNGVIQHLTGTPGSPNDDFVALNADDCLTRLQNLDVVCGPIENIVIHDLFSKECHSFVRLLSVDSTIANIHISKLRGGCKAFAVNMDAARYCRTPLIDPDEPRYREGVGDVRNVVVEDAFVYPTQSNKSLICLESNMDNFVVRDFRVDTARACVPPTPALNLSNVRASNVALSGLTEAQGAGLNAEPYENALGETQWRAESTTVVGEALWVPFGPVGALTVSKAGAR